MWLVDETVLEVALYLVDIGKRRLKVIPKVFHCQTVLEKHGFFHLEDLNACFQVMI